MTKTVYCLVIMLVVLSSCLTVLSTTLHEIIEKNDIKACTELLNQVYLKKLINDYTTYLVTPLHYAIIYNRTEIYHLLIEHKADPNLTDLYDRNSPLHAAARRGNKELCALLIEHGANPNQPNRFGCTPLHFAAENGYQEVCKLLLDHGALASVVELTGKKPSDFALEEGHLDLAKFLKSYEQTLFRYVVSA